MMFYTVTTILARKYPPLLTVATSTGMDNLLKRKTAKVELHFQISHTLATRGRNFDLSKQGFFTALAIEKRISA